MSYRRRNTIHERHQEMIFSLLAQAANHPAPDSMISGNWILALIPVIAGGIALVLSKINLNKAKAINESTKVEIQTPAPTFSVQPVYPPPSWDQHKALERRVENAERHIEELRNDQGKQFRDILEAGVERETRILEKLDAVARGFHSRVDDLLKLPSSRTRQ